MLRLVVGVLALVILQVSIASHQFAHAADDPIKSCRVCTLHNDHDDAPATAHTVTTIDLPAVPCSATIVNVSIAAQFTSHNARAPPRG